MSTFFEICVSVRILRLSFIIKNDNLKAYVTDPHQYVSGRYAQKINESLRPVTKN